MKDIHSNLWLVSAVARIATFLFLFSLIVLSLFLLGNFQNFLDSTQVMLLHLFEGSSFLYVVTALYYLFLQIGLAITGRQRGRVFPALVSLAAAAFLFGAYLVVGFLFAWLKPLN